MNLSDKSDLEAAVVSGVTLDKDVAKITLLGLPFDTKLVSKIFSSIAEAGVNVDIIVHNLPEPGGKTTHLGFTTTKGEVEASLAAVKRVWSKGASDHTVETDCAKVSVVGVGMRSHPGVAATTFHSLSEAGIDIRMVSTSEIKISCVVDAGKADSACQVLHKAFIA